MEFTGRLDSNRIEIAHFYRSCRECPFAEGWTIGGSYYCTKGEGDLELMRENLWKNPPEECPLPRYKITIELIS